MESEVLGVVPVCNSKYLLSDLCFSDCVDVVLFAELVGVFPELNSMYLLSDLCLDSFVSLLLICGNSVELVEVVVAAGAAATVVVGMTFVFSLSTLREPFLLRMKITIIKTTPIHNKTTTPKTTPIIIDVDPELEEDPVATPSGDVVVEPKGALVVGEGVGGVGGVGGPCGVGCGEGSGVGWGVGGVLVHEQHPTTLEFGPWLSPATHASIVKHQIQPGVLTHPLIPKMSRQLS